MSRRRSSNPTKAISVTIPELLLRNIDRTLSYEQSRSLWITNACREYLNKTDSTPFDVRNLTYKSLLKWIINHDDVDEVLKTLLLQFSNELYVTDCHRFRCVNCSDRLFFSRCQVNHLMKKVVQIGSRLRKWLRQQWLGSRRVYRSMLLLHRCQHLQQQRRSHWWR